MADAKKISRRPLDHYPRPGGTKNADEVENALRSRVPRQRRTAFSNAMILHGRQT